ncbi:udp-n-acetylglucosamine--peptide n-acetylglucosaminyltransferase spindly [Hordeum vulgare]|nr:udp-n-acetylglucosamine--peptide n-acetylglucosaminyltransferase spindly [Hordeum vulgare]
MSTLFHFITISCLCGVQEVGEEVLHRHALLVEEDQGGEESGGVQAVDGRSGQEARARREENHDRREEGALKEKRVKIAANAEDAKMLILNVNSLDADARFIMQSYRYQMLQRQKDELTAAVDYDYEDAAEADEVAAYAATTIPP